MPSRTMRPATAVGVGCRVGSDSFTVRGAGYTVCATRLQRTEAQGGGDLQAGAPGLERPAAEPEPADETAAFHDACRRLPEAAAEALSLLPGAAGSLQAGRPFRPRPAEPGVAIPLLAHVLSAATRSLEERASEAFRRHLV